MVMQKDGTPIRRPSFVHFGSEGPAREAYDRLAMATVQHSPSQQTVREEERVLAISYERALAMIPRLVRRVTGAQVQTLGDGYFVAETTDSRRELTIRLGRQGPDTRFSVRVESRTIVWMIVLVAVVAIGTAGLGVFPLIPWLQSVARREARERELLVHKTFRAIEDAVAEQDLAKGYRIAPGADVLTRAGERDELFDEAPGEERRKRSGRAV